MTKMKGKLLQDIVDKKRKIYEVAEIFKVSRKSVGIWLSKYKADGIQGIISKKPGPKSGETHNRTDRTTNSRCNSPKSSKPGCGDEEKVGRNT